MRRRSDARVTAIGIAVDRARDGFRAKTARGRRVTAGNRAVFLQENNVSLQENVFLENMKTTI